MEFHDLDSSDRAALSVFRCAMGGRRPWTVEAEIMVRQLLPDTLDAGHVHGIGMWEGEQLLGLVAWEETEPGIWHSAILAVSEGHVGSGLGSRLKERMLDRARAAGIREVRSTVHIDNGGMLKINEKVGAHMTRESPSSLYMLCSVFL